MRSTGSKYGKRENWFATDNLSGHGFAMLCRLVAAESLRLTVDEGHLLSFIDWRQWPVLAGTIESAGWGLRAACVWDKCAFGMGNGFRQQAEFIVHASKGLGDNFVRHDLGTVFRYSRDLVTDHPTAKPVPLLCDLISALPGRVLLDPFAGSGSAGVAAKALGWRAILIELAEQNAELAARRVQKLDIEGAEL